MTRIISVDPGSKKCGLLLADREKSIVLEGKVVKACDVLEHIIAWCELEPVSLIILGNGTSSKYWAKSLGEISPIKLIDERGTTLLARKRYWELWPPIKWLSWVPRGLLLPPDQLDAIAALVLLEDYLNTKLRWPYPPDFKIEP